MIRLNNVNKYFNRRKANEIHVINNTTLELPESGIVTILGPSGCGKTTLLNAIGGLDKVNSGQIFIDDANMTRGFSGKKDALRNAKIGYIFQNFNLLDKVTVFENVAIALRMIGIKDKKVIAERVNYCLTAVGIYQYRNKTADALSGGQRQRVAIARAIVKNPRIIIADEPTGNLDSANTLEIMNIIKAISREKLVLLVTHERKIAEFYSDRIIEMKDGVIIADYVNDSSKFLDYQLENKIYLKDMPVTTKFRDGELAVDVYSDEAREAGIKLVLRGGNLYINTGGRFNVVDENANIEMIDDHYSMIDQSIYEGNKFDYDAHMPGNFRTKYKSLYNPVNMITRGFKTMVNFKAIKKLLLIGFVFSAMFSFMAISKTLGVLDIKEKDFLTTNEHYITVSNPEKTVDLLNKLNGMEGVTYAIPGKSVIQMSVPLNDYYQTSRATMPLNGSMTFLSTLDKADVKYGRMPENSHEIVVDKMIIDKFLGSKGGVPVGITKVEQFLDRSAKVPNLADYKIVGISDTNSPSIYLQEDQYMFILANAAEGNMSAESMGPVSPYNEYGESMPDMSDGGVKILDYKLAPDALKIKRGDAPTDDYDVIVNNAHYQEDGFALNKTVKKRMNKQKLTLVGFYTSDTTDDIYYVSSGTILKNYVSKNVDISVYAEKPQEVQAALNAEGLQSKINYNRDKKMYLREMRKSMSSSFIVSGIILIIALIEMFLMLRSSFLSRIKEVGTLRAIGVKKRDIYSMFAGEIIAISITTSIPGIALMYYILSNIVKISDFIAAGYMLNWMTVVIAFAVILIFNLFAGLIPVWKTMRKTPAAILARTDI